MPVPALCRRIDLRPTLLSTRSRRTVFAALLLLGYLGAGVGPRAEASEEASAAALSGKIRISGEGIDELVLTAKELADMPRLSVEAEDHGVHARFEGVALSTMLARAGAPQGEKLRGDKLALALVVDATDGYRALFALPELDPAFTERVVFLADRRDGRPLSDTEGPFRVVVVGEKRQARWVRQVTSLRLVRVAGDRP